MARKSLVFHKCPRPEVELKHFRANIMCFECNCMIGELFEVLYDGKERFLIHLDCFFKFRREYPKLCKPGMGFYYYADQILVKQGYAKAKVI